MEQWDSRARADKSGVGYNSNPVDPSERKKAARKAKKQKGKKKALAKGRQLKSDEDYLLDTKAQIAQDIAEKRLKIFEETKMLSVQPQDRLDYVQQHDPGFYDWLSSEGEIHVGPQHTFEQNRVIWYNDLDRTYSFNTTRDYPPARAACRIVSKALEDDEMDRVPQLLILFAMACKERRYNDVSFTYRDKFLHEWKTQQASFRLPGRKLLVRLAAARTKLEAVLAKQYNGTNPEIFAQMKEGDGGLWLLDSYGDLEDAADSRSVAYNSDYCDSSMERRVAELTQVGESGDQAGMAKAMERQRGWADGGY